MCLQYNNTSKYTQSNTTMFYTKNQLYASTIDGTHHPAYHKNLKNKFKSYTSSCVFV
jgi:hypothetical protein